MVLSAEWRTKGELNDVILIVDDVANTVRQALPADPKVLTDFLNDMSGLDSWQGSHALDDEKRNPEAWGELVISRANTGEVIDMDPELFWNGIYDWFRSRGVDPNPMRR